MSSLFRQEALDHQRRCLWGEVILTQRMSYWAILALLVFIICSIGIFAATQTYARKENVQGYLVPDGGVTRFFADSGGRVTGLSVSVGDRVAKGAIIGALRTDRALADGQTVSEALIASVQADIANVAALITTRAARAVDQKQQLANQLALQNKQITASGKELAVLDDRITLAQTQADSLRALADKGNASRAALNQRMEALLSLKQSHTAMQRQILSLRQARNATKGELHSFDLRQREAELELKSRQEALSQQLVNMTAQASRPLVAPSSGVIESLYVADGGSVKAGQTIAEIRPAGSALQAYLLVPSRAVGLIQQGQRVQLQYDAFPYQRFGIFEGMVSDISASIVAPGELPLPIQMQESFYLVRASINSQTVTVKGADVALKSGMLLRADITLETRSLLQWLLDPIYSLKGRI